MKPQEIKEKIDANNALIEKLITPSFFTLNKQVQDLFDQNEALRTQCTHEFCFGRCKYCYKQQ